MISVCSVYQIVYQYLRVGQNWVVAMDQFLVVVPKFSIHTHEAWELIVFLYERGYLIVTVVDSPLQDLGYLTV